MTDFIVIGGGIAGLTAGAHLSALGQVTLLERESQLGYHASGRSAALFEQNYGSASTMALSRASAEALGTDNGGVLSPRGFVMLGKAGEDTAFDTDLAALGLDEITPEDAIARVPILNPEVLTRAAYQAEAQDIDTNQLIQNNARAITRSGGQIVGQADVTKVDRTRLGWTVRTGKGDIYGGKVLVNAAGAWADDLALMARIAPIGLTPCRRSMGRIPAPGGHDVSTWPMIFGPGETWYAKPDAGALIVSPADEDATTPHDAFADDLTLAEGFARYEAYVTTPVTRLLSSWAGLRTFSPDRQLVLGADPSDPTFIWCAAQGGYGFQTAPAAGRLIADVAAGRTPEIGADIAALLSPARYR